MYQSQQRSVDIHWRRGRLRTAGRLTSCSAAPCMPTGTTALVPLFDLTSEVTYTSPWTMKYLPRMITTSSSASAQRVGKSQPIVNIVMRRERYISSPRSPSLNMQSPSSAAVCLRAMQTRTITASSMPVKKNELRIRSPYLLSVVSMANQSQKCR
jgi:hypothetical protein